MVELPITRRTPLQIRKWWKCLEDVSKFKKLPTSLVGVSEFSKWETYLFPNLSAGRIFLFIMKRLASSEVIVFAKRCASIVTHY